MPAELCLALGSSPGGWTWVLAKLGARVLILDKAPLAPAVAAMPGVEYRAESAFGFEPRGTGCVFTFPPTYLRPAQTPEAEPSPLPQRHSHLRREADGVASYGRPANPATPLLHPQPALPSPPFHTENEHKGRTMKEIRDKAREMMKGSCRVCPACDGRVCAGEVPGMGGLGDGSAFKNNVRALAETALNMRLIHDAKEPATAAHWLGLTLSAPVLAAPIGGMFNFKDAVSEGFYIDAVLQGCRAAGVIGCTGDGVPPVIINSALAGLKAVDGRGIPFIKPWDGAELDEKLERALAVHCPILGMDIDAAGLITLRKMGRPVGPKTVRELLRITDKVHAAGAKFLVKGIMTVSDAHLAVEAGVDGIVVSNHGGRVFAAAPGTAKVLPAIAKAVGQQTAIMVDGGVRNGIDVFKMLALGADVVGIGRPVTIAAIGGGKDGVAKYLDQIRDELAQTMILTGCRSIAEIAADVVYTDRD